MKEKHSLPNEQLVDGEDFSRQIASELASVPGVQAIYSTPYDRGGVLFVWTIVADRDPDLYDRLYEKETQIIDSYEKVRFDFTVLPSRGKDPRSLILDPSAQLVYVAPNATD